MPKLKIDNLEIEVPKGTKVIEAADRLGIPIPRFCYHPALGSVGACRMCAVMFGEGPVKGIQMSCMIDAQEGMVVSTRHPEAVAFRRQVIEWLMVNHPHDCPVCDEGGQCLLQDMTVSSDHGIRRYRGRKRTYRDQYLGPLVQHEMNRCIHCYRCSRFYQEFAGYRDLGPMQIAYRTYFGRHQGGVLESPFAGNLVDICPTGVYTDKPARFHGRRWDFQRGPSLCINCSLGCHTVGSARLRRVVMMEAEFSEAVNGYFICDRGRHGFQYAGHPERPRRPRIGTRETSWREALEGAADALGRIGKKDGANSIAALTSPRSSLENLAMLRRVCRIQGWKQPIVFTTSSLDQKVRTVVSRLDESIAVSQREIENSDFILIAGADPVNEAPMVVLAMRQAVRRGAAVAVLDPRPVFLPFEYEHIPVSPGEINGCLSTLVRRALEGYDPAPLGANAALFYRALPPEYASSRLQDRLSFAEEKLKKSHRPVLVCGTDLVPVSTPLLAADHALLLKGAKGSAGLFFVLPGANAFGAALLAPEEGSLARIVKEIEEGTVRALVVVENDPYRTYPNRKRWEQAVSRLDFMLVMDYLPTLTAQAAHVFFPTATLFETESSFVNQEGRLQFARPFFAGGTPVEQISHGGHPPRVFSPEIPGAEPRPAWQVLLELAPSLSGDKEPTGLNAEAMWQRMKEDYPFLSDVRPYESVEGLRILPERSRAVSFGDPTPFLPSKGKGEEIKGKDFLLLPVDWTFGTEELSDYSEPIRQVEKPPCIYLQAEDAYLMGLKEQDRIRLLLDGGSLEVDLKTPTNMARGVLILPRHRKLEWQKFKEVPARISPDRIEKSKVQL